MNTLVSFALLLMLFCVVEGKGWGGWSEWSCTGMCDATHQQRIRKCEISRKGECHGKTKEFRASNCTCSAAWGRWSEWTCPEQCNATYQQRNRTCTRPERNACFGPDSERRPSECVPCSAAWSRWSDWACTDICDATYQERNRTCAEPGANACHGQRTQTRPSECVPCTQAEGQWEEWTSWICQSDQCLYTYSEYRRRTCRRLPIHFENIYCLGNDRQDRTVCPPYRWGAHCASNCFSCVDQCDDEGRCSTCLVGYKYPNYSCYQECEEFEFGANCEGDCKQKCGEDCTERIDGTCPFKKSSLLWLLVLLIPLGLLAHFLEHKKGEPDESDDPTKTAPTDTTARDTGDRTEATTTVYSTGTMTS